MNFGQTDGTSYDKFAAERTRIENPPAVMWRLCGNFYDCKEAYAFLDAFRDDVKNSEAPIIVDLEAVDHMSSCGAGILAACYCSASNAKREMYLAGGSRRADAVLTVVGLTRVIETFPNREDALRHVAK
jgi:anti-anti-sigma factor